jgi:hypothetical protein
LTHGKSTSGKQGKAVKERKGELILRRATASPTTAAIAAKANVEGSGKAVFTIENEWVIGQR